MANIYSLRPVTFDASDIFVKIKEAMKLHFCPCANPPKSPTASTGPPTRRRGGRPPLQSPTSAPASPRCARAHAAARRACSTPALPRQKRRPPRQSPGLTPKTPARPPSCSKHPRGYLSRRRPPPTLLCRQRHSSRAGNLRRRPSSPPLPVGAAGSAILLSRRRSPPTPLRRRRRCFKP